jgi:hypothetical protein
VAVFVDVAAAKTEMPINDTDGPVQDELVEPGLFGGLPHGRLGRRFVLLQMALGEAPVLVGIPDEQVGGRLTMGPAENNTSGTDLQLRSTFAH